MLPIVSAALTIARAVKGMTMPDVAVLAGVTVDEVFDSENFIDDVDPISVQLIAIALDIDLTKLTDFN